MSFYATFNISFIEGLSVLFKYDALDAGVHEDDYFIDGDIEVSGNVTTLLAGFSYQWTKGITFSPNMTQTTIRTEDPATAINFTFKLKF